MFSKAAVVSLTQILSKEFSKLGITVNAIGPTPVETDLIKSVPKEKIQNLREDLIKFIKYLEQELDKKKEYLFNIIFNWVDTNLTEESIEYVVSLFLEPYDEIVDQLTPTMSADEEKFFNYDSTEMYSFYQTKNLKK